jgi:hypothetical protein
VAFFSDLTQCTYFPGETSKLVAVGWLEHGHTFEVGSVNEMLLLRLRELLTDPWAPVDYMGPHFCTLCSPTEARRWGGVGNLFVPSERCVFVCPELIVHYVDQHQYLPPRAFRAAVLDCPPMGSPEYLAAVAAHYRFP